MLKRKVGIVAGVFCSALLLTGCGKSAKDEFIQGIGNQNAQESGVWDFSMSIDLWLRHGPVKSAVFGHQIGQRRVHQQLLHNLRAFWK